ncbi:DUF4351 domain-containing protein [Castellaniella sp.]|uniref:DUF4351 domain-containing protein n=1 Tax=Castellaniella sp. TaxID=1955812 RepID=UPI002AFE95DB|nr:DUF4351 domain-containing protein [Castellaniella sp.]
MPNRQHHPSTVQAISRKPKPTADDHDSPWKDALEQFFPQAIQLLAPDLYALIDWSIPPVFLDKELQAIQRAAASAEGRLLVDKLVKVHLHTGHPAHLQVHLEAQGRLATDADFQVFSWRVFQYRTLLQIRDMRQRNLKSPPPIYSLGILIDQLDRGDPPVTQLRHQDKLLSQKTEFIFPVVELSQWANRLDELDALAPSNPFAIFVMAQIQASRHPDKSTRLRPLVDLVRRLYSYGYSQPQIGQLLRLLEWVVRLPPDLETDYLQEAQQLEQEYEMSYVTIAERVYTQKGIEQGLERGIEQGQASLLLRLIERRFGSQPDCVQEKIRTASSPQLEAWSLNFVDAQTLEDVFA